MLPIDNRLMEVGKIKIGGLGEERQKKSGGTFRLPTKSDHFTVVTNERDQKGDFKIDADVMKALGPKPVEIDIILLHNTIEENWQSYRAYYTANGKVFCRSDDSEVASRASVTRDDQGEIQNVDYTTRTEVPCPCPYADAHHPDNVKNITLCKPHGRLTCILPQSPQLGGVYVFRTTSWNSIRNIQSQLEFISSLTHGILAGLRFTLRLSPKSTTYTDANGQKRPTTIYEVGLIFKGDHSDLYRMAEQSTKAILSGNVQLASLASQRRRIESSKFEADSSVTEEFNPDVVAESIEVVDLKSEERKEPATREEKVDEEVSQESIPLEDTSDGGISL